MADEFLADVNGNDRLEEFELEEIRELNEKDEDELSDGEVTSKTKLSLKRRFDYPSWVLVFEFQNRHGRRADCLALNTQSSRNFKLVGFEFKSSRSDWLSEKKNPEKNDYFVELCDEWYVVAGRRGIIEKEEVPDGWGFLEVKPSGRIYKIIESDLNDMQNTDLDRRFFAKFMRKAVGGGGGYTGNDIKEAERRGYEKAKSEGVKKHTDREIQRLRDKAESYDKLRDTDLNLWSSISDERIQRLVRAEELLNRIEKDDYGDIRGMIRSLERTIETTNERMNEEVELIRETVDELEEMTHTVSSPTETSDSEHE